MTHLEAYNALQDVADFVTLVSSHTEGFSVVLEKNGSIIPGVYEPVMQLACLDASLAVKPVFERFRSVIITSGTLSPLDMYPKLLNFDPVVRVSLDMSYFPGVHLSDCRDQRQRQPVGPQHTLRTSRQPSRDSELR